MGQYALETERPLRVMTVDDDPMALEIIECHCASFGFRFYGLQQPHLAEDLACALMPDVIITDAMMPGINGFELCAKFRANPGLELIPIVMMTSLNGRDDRVRAMDAGATEFLTKPVDRLELGARVRSLGRTRRQVEVLDCVDRVLDSLALCAEARDHTTGEHCDRLRLEARSFADFLGLDRPDAVALERGAVLHDIGKIAVPDSILQKPGKLTAEEWDVMKTHAAVGADLIAPLGTMTRVHPIVKHHHERWDGGGYPSGLSAEGIPALARIFQLLDAWDAITHERPYKRAFSAHEALALMKQEASEGRWDPRFFESFAIWKSE